MVSLYLTKCHRIIDQQKKEREVVGVAVYLAKGICTAEFLKLEESKILMFVINGENDTSKDKYFSKSL